MISASHPIMLSLRGSNLRACIKNLRAILMNDRSSVSAAYCCSNSVLVYGASINTSHNELCFFKFFCLLVLPLETPSSQEITCGMSLTKCLANLKLKRKHDYYCNDTISTSRIGTNESWIETLFFRLLSLTNSSTGQIFDPGRTFKTAPKRYAKILLAAIWESIYGLRDWFRPGSVIDRYRT